MINKSGFRNITSRQISSGVSRLVSRDRNVFLFTIEGILITLVNNLINNNNLLFAQRLGADDLMLSLVVALPQVVGMVMLIPGGLMTDRMHNKRRMVVASLLALAISYVLIGFVPMLGGWRLLAFIGLLSLSFGPATLYNSSWQAYFSDVIPLENRNRTLTKRTAGTFLVAVVAPLATGFLLTSAATNQGKIQYHQIFFWVSSALLIVQVFTLNRISGGENEKPVKLGIRDLKNAVTELSGNKKFLGFVGVALFFYITWQSDWTLYYLGQVDYLKMNEAWLSYANIGAAVIMLLGTGFWSRVNEKRGIRFTMILGTVGLAFCPIAMITATSLPLSIGPAVFLAMHILANFTFPTVTLDIIQCLLQVIPEKNKSLSIALYTVLVTLSNAVMPVVGVQIYSAFGSTLHALRMTFLIIFISRVIAAGLWTLRWRLLRNEPQ